MGLKQKTKGDYFVDKLLFVKCKGKFRKISPFLLIEIF